MLTYSFEHAGGKPMYEYLYECIRRDILTGRLRAGEKLPSKRMLARNLGISTITVEGAYGQLTAEGYCQAKARKGFFVSDVIGQEGKIPPAEQKTARQPEPEEPHREHREWLADFAANSVQPRQFPFASWTRLLRKVVDGEAEALMERSPGFGALALRQAVADHLWRFRGLSVQPEQIVIGAGTEYLYSLLVQFFGRNKRFCVENPGYDRIRKIYGINGADCVLAGMDEQGVKPEDLTALRAQILHISPSHHFPTGIIMPISRRYELLGWAAAAPDRYIIEDDYDSEFRLAGRPIPTMMGIDVSSRVIYMNTFSKSLTPTIRISYMVLPARLVKPFRQKLGFYSCTVSNFEQYTLARFIQQGCFEKHINRMRTYYRRKREQLLSLLREAERAGQLDIIEHGSGLHFLLRLHIPGSDRAFQQRLAERRVWLKPLADYYEGEPEHCRHVFVLNYSGVSDQTMKPAVRQILACLAE